LPRALKKKADQVTRADTTSVFEKRVVDSNGTIRRILALDTSSKTFATDLHYVFKRNVAKARKENRDIAGVADRLPKKASDKKEPKKPTARVSRSK
jgi:hypothetical protein